MSDELSVLNEVASKLNGADIPYMISGSVAMNFYAQPRMTRDIDVVVVLKPADINTFVALFESDYYVDRDTVQKEVQRKGMFNLIHNELIVKVDFIMRKEGEYDDVAFSRRRKINIDDMHVWIISPEDLILSKCLWSKESMSEMQIRDVRNLIEVRENLDSEYMTSWVDRLGLKEVYERVQA